MDTRTSTASDLVLRGPSVGRKQKMGCPGSQRKKEGQFKVLMLSLRELRSEPGSTRATGDAKGQL
jgi:hypothetical protein